MLQAQFAFADEQRLNSFTQALQKVIQRHDILRTSLFWDGLQDPVQVVWREAPLACEALELNGADGDVLEQLRRRFDAAQYRMAVNQAPLMRVVHAWIQPISGWWRCCCSITWSWTTWRWRCCNTRCRRS